MGCMLSNLCYPPQHREMKRSKQRDEIIRQFRNGKLALVAVNMMDLNKYEHFVASQAPLPEWMQTKWFTVRIPFDKAPWPESEDDDFGVFCEYEDLEHLKLTMLSNHYDTSLVLRGDGTHKLMIYDSDPSRLNLPTRPNDVLKKEQYPSDWWLNKAAHVYIKKQLEKMNLDPEPMDGRNIQGDVYIASPSKDVLEKVVQEFREIVHEDPDTFKYELHGHGIEDRERDRRYIACVNCYKNKKRNEAFCKVYSHIVCVNCDDCGALLEGDDIREALKQSVRTATPTVNPQTYLSHGYAINRSAPVPTLDPVHETDREESSSMVEVDNPLADVEESIPTRVIGQDQTHGAPNYSAFPCARRKRAKLMIAPTKAGTTYALDRTRNRQWAEQHAHVLDGQFVSDKASKFPGDRNIQDLQVRDYFENMYREQQVNDPKLLGWLLHIMHTFKDLLRKLQLSNLHHDAVTITGCLFPMAACLHSISVHIIVMLENFFLLPRELEKVDMDDI